MGPIIRGAVLAACVAATVQSARAADEPAPIPKEGSYGTLTMGSATYKRVEQGKDRSQTSWEFVGVAQGDDGKGLLHNASVHCIGSGHSAGGEYENYTNACVWTRPDGDQLFHVEKLVSGKAGAVSKGTSTIVGGTGKLAGITGGNEWTRYFVRPAAEGTLQTVTRSKGTYKLP